MLCAVQGRVARYMYAITSESAYRVAEVPVTPPRRSGFSSSDASQQTSLLDLRPAQRPGQTLRDPQAPRRPGSRRDAGSEEGRRAGARAMALERPWGGAAGALREPRPYFYRVQARSYQYMFPCCRNLAVHRSCYACGR